MKPIFLATIVSGLLVAPLWAQPRSLFDGHSFDGWQGNTKNIWRIEDKALMAGSLETEQKQNDFLATTKEFSDFDLKLKWKLEGTSGFINGGVQFRSQRIENHHEVSGYQADLGAGYDGALYDESRRNKVLAKPTAENLDKARRPLGQWNEYRIHAEGDHIQLWLNGIQTVDYIESDPDIARSGIIALQIHGGAKAIVRYKDLSITPLNDN
jgi:hypothetical protein